MSLHHSRMRNRTDTTITKNPNTTISSPADALADGEENTGHQPVEDAVPMDTRADNDSLAETPDPGLDNRTTQVAVRVSRPVSLIARAAR